MSNAETLKQLIRIWAILEDVSPRTIMYRVMHELKIETLKDDENAQKLAITYLSNKLKTQGDDRVVHM